MANKYPYVHSAGPLVKTVNHLRKSFPKVVTAETLRKLGVAPKNESYVINVLRFLGIIDEEGQKVEGKTKAFLQHKDDEFSGEFKKLVKDAYEELFELHGDESWKLDRSDLTQFFRTTDRSSDVVGTRQAATFLALAALSGYAELPELKQVTQSRKPKASSREGSQSNTSSRHSKKTRNSEQVINKDSSDDSGSPIGLTVRIEVNLPASGDQQTYDRIFQSIRKNLLNGS